MRMRRPVRTALAAITLALGTSLAVASTAVAAVPVSHAGATAATAHAAYAAATASVTELHPLNNEGAAVTDPNGHRVSSELSGRCPVGDVCLYTDPDYQGQEFDLYYCGTYALSGWTEDGSIINNETGGAVAHTYYEDGTLDQTIGHNFYGIGYLDPWHANPDYFVAPCF